MAAPSLLPRGAGWTAWPVVLLARWWSWLMFVLKSTAGGSCGAAEAAALAVGGGSAPRPAGLGPEAPGCEPCMHVCA
eukprot:1158822-Pelagomonas_calceolata.AAC.1